MQKNRGDFNGDKIISRDPHVGFSILLRMTIRIIGRDPHVSPLDFLRMTVLKIGMTVCV